MRPIPPPPPCPLQSRFHPISIPSLLPPPPPRIAADGTALLGASAFAFTFTIDGAITTVVADDPVEEELARRRDRDASKKRDSDSMKKRDGDSAKKRDGDARKKRGRDGGMDRGEESDAARGWSSAVVERGLALRRRGGSTSCCRPRCGLIVGEGARSREEAAASGAAQGVGAEAAAVAAEEPLVDPTLEFFYLAVL
ncbi:hypothetical protein SETIT_5G037400v2 [Setaria italica]|uniref:Uncharacterized protein n=2 Tax=Setaria italica TaxID=4555 RepID=A0A368R0X5_SETIT|nr:hypothetical protein SETIT_5G037400v2 [Setaria italica]